MGCLGGERYCTVLDAITLAVRFRQFAAMDRTTTAHGRRQRLDMMGVGQKRDQLTRTYPLSHDQVRKSYDSRSLKRQPQCRLRICDGYARRDFDNVDAGRSAERPILVNRPRRNNNAIVLAEFARRARRPATLKIRGRCADDPLKTGDLADNQCAVGHGSAADGNIDVFFDQVDHPLGGR